jgi:nucleotide-binding universal stress UspA family protein
MLNIRTILCPTDFSTHSASAYGKAMALARDYAATVLVLHVWHWPTVIHCRAGAIPVAEPDKIRTEAKMKLDAWPSAEAKAPIERLLLEGDTAEVILRTARNRNCDLIVMGTHGRSGLDRMVLGSVTEDVLRRASCPVLTVRVPKPSDIHPLPVEDDSIKFELAHV